VKGDTAAREIETASSLASRLGMSFSNFAVLHRALTHRSYLNEHKDSGEDNERLEFLGDAVLDFIVGAWVYHRFPEMPEGELTKLRSAIVRNEQLAAFARKIELGNALRLGRGESSSGGFQRDNLLGSAFEALIGAIYLDAGLDAVRDFVDPLLEEARASVLTEIGDPKSQLQEWAQSQKFGAPRYHTVASTGPDHARVFEVEVDVQGQVQGRGRGSSKHAAEQSAAQDAIDNLAIN